MGLKVAEKVVETADCELTILRVKTDLSCFTLAGILHLLHQLGKEAVY